MATPTDETKQEKFKRVVQPRVCKVLRGINLIGNCASNAYAYTPDDIANITAALLTAVTQLEERFKSKGKQEVSFTL